MLEHQKHVAITYTTGSLARGAATLTVRWSDDHWKSATDTPMTRQNDGFWRASVGLPASTATLTMAFFHQSGIWDNNGGNNDALSVAQHQAALCLA